MSSTRKEANVSPKITSIFISFVSMCMAVMVGYSLLQMRGLHWPELVAVLFLAVLTSRMKIKLPGLNGNMSVNLPFLLIAAVQLSLFESLLIAAASTLAQCFPKAGSKPNTVQILFNVSIVSLAIGLGSLCFQYKLFVREALISASLLMTIVTAVVFLAQTIPVAAIISLTEGAKILRIWSSIFLLSFPYYLLSAGITSIVTTVSRHFGWQIPLLLLPAMYAVYRSYQLYFAQAVSLTDGFALAKAASTTR